MLRKHIHNQISQHVHCTPEINKCCRDKSSSLLESVPSRGIINLLEYEELRVLYLVITENRISLTYNKLNNLQKLGNTQYHRQVVKAGILHFPSDIRPNVLKFSVKFMYKIVLFCICHSSSRFIHFNVLFLIFVIFLLQNISVYNTFCSIV